MTLKFIYILFIGMLFATLVGVGIAAYYESPKTPEYPSILKIQRPEALSEPVFKELTTAQKKYDKEFAVYTKKLQIYNRNVSIISLIAALITVIISLIFFKKILLIADGLLLGGVVTLIYSIIRGFDTGDSKFRFLVVMCGFIISVVLGYLKFIKTLKTS